MSACKLRSATALAASLALALPPVPLFAQEGDVNELLARCTDGGIVGDDALERCVQAFQAGEDGLAVGSEEGITPEEAEAPAEPAVEEAADAPAEQPVTKKAPAEETAEQAAPVEAEEVQAEEVAEPVEEAPAEDPPSEVVAEDAPEAAPVEQAEGTAPEEAPAEDQAAEEAPGETASEENAAEAAEPEAAPVEESVAQDAPAEPEQESVEAEAPAETAPVEEAPVEEAGDAAPAEGEVDVEATAETEGEAAPSETQAETEEAMPAEEGPSEEAEVQVETEAQDAPEEAEATAQTSEPEAPAAPESEIAAQVAAQPEPELNEEEEQAARQAEAALGALEALVQGETEGATAAAAAALDGEGSGEVVEEQITEETARSSDEEFTTEAVQTESRSDDDEGGLSNRERFALGALGVLAVGTLLNNRSRVVSNSGDRVIVQRDDGALQVLKDDDALLRRPGSNVRTESFDDGSTRTVVEREDGSRVITIRDASLRVLRRSVITPGGEEFLLIDDTQPAEPVEVTALPQIETTASGRTPEEEALRAALAREAGLQDRRFTLAQVRQIPQVRALAPALDVDTVTFRSGSAAIQPDQADELTAVAQEMLAAIQENPREIFLIEGHTDAVGDAAYNLALSDRRAESLALALNEYFGVPVENMVVQGYGEQFLRVQTQAAEEANRRAVARRITNLLQTAAAN
ncbi:OmpA family protein [Jannaschia aquimarina]|uniref:Putative outer membrane lipoprotein n=1 Tax=Jannaschia aquimarina TaxID=935700 RepID=A0A0D1EQZ7_9RHOB|nr:OmpA family protein [Jannaschia aquimarina]KIT18065.1 putative outer membrane lipoprotein [Jannaschia aquimarina]SNS89629.1 Outer membrane protein OmpA [Jannaschia aquimarina]